MPPIKAKHPSPSLISAQLENLMSTVDAIKAASQKVQIKIRYPGSRSHWLHFPLWLTGVVFPSNVTVMYHVHFLNETLNWVSHLQLSNSSLLQVLCSAQLPSNASPQFAWIPRHWLQNYQTAWIWMRHSTSLMSVRAASSPNPTLLGFTSYFAYFRAVQADQEQEKPSTSSLEWYVAANYAHSCTGCSAITALLQQTTLSLLFYLKLPKNIFYNQLNFSSLFFFFHWTTCKWYFNFWELELRDFYFWYHEDCSAMHNMAVTVK